MNNILVIRVPDQGSVDFHDIRDYILESLPLGVLVLPDDATLEVMELPELGDLAGKLVEPAPPEPCKQTPIEAGVEAAVLSERQKRAQEKQEIVQRLKDYRAAHGPGCFAEVSAKTAHRVNRRISDDVLRNIAADGAPKMSMEDWRKIGKALDQVEDKNNDSDCA